MHRRAVEASVAKADDGKSDGGTSIDQIVNFAGNKCNVPVLRHLMDSVMLSFFHWDTLRHIGIEPVHWILLDGPPGSRKMMFARAIANLTGARFYEVSAPELVSENPGDSLKNIGQVFSNALKTAPCIIFVIPFKWDPHRGLENAVVSKLKVSLDKLREQLKSSEAHVLVIAATSRLDTINPALRIPGRFDNEVYISSPDEKAMRVPFECDYINVVNKNNTRRCLKCIGG